MKNLKILAVCLFTVFVGLFILSKTKKETVRDVASVKKTKPEKKVEEKEAALTPETKVIPPSKVNMALERSTIESIPESKTELKEGEFPMHKGRFVARVLDGRLLSPVKGSMKKLLFSKDPTHPDIERRASKFFKAMGFDSDKKMKIQRGKSYFLVSGESALKVEAFKVNYNWNGKPKETTFLIRSTTGRYYKKLAEL